MQPRWWPGVVSATDRDPPRAARNADLSRLQIAEQMALGLGETNVVKRPWVRATLIENQLPAVALIGDDAYVLEVKSGAKIVSLHRLPLPALVVDAHAGSLRRRRLNLRESLESRSARRVHHPLEVFGLPAPSGRSAPSNEANHRGRPDTRRRWKSGKRPDRMGFKGLRSGHGRRRSGPSHQPEDYLIRVCADRSFLETAPQITAHAPGCWPRRFDPACL